MHKTYTIILNDYHYTRHLEGMHQKKLDKYDVELINPSNKMFSKCQGCARYEDTERTDMTSIIKELSG